MSASLSESIAWDTMTSHEKLAAVHGVFAGQRYSLDVSFCTAELLCLNGDTLQFRVLQFRAKEGGDTQDITGWLVTLDRALVPHLALIPKEAA
jgi:hypothetical protein